ncbi:ankyrin repeat and BTB/POZ domain-containing protein 1 [Ophiocordyceps sinensis CO18]|uniref:Ankyrin repeat and BTB/POZ domain-containing protein 1 n=1 Tax=Ophiocordyceps sinensis (strain Co18 / CGMCC 3.14243) TaxID=911162 RepID=T5A3D7_OPHSC|nr:ankyrin repeat and BTB/POZ domain-containing protein 1 [Ophiocordyceps sinensis CO18]
MVLHKHELDKRGDESCIVKSGLLRDDSPLDQSPEFDAFVLACRHGDLRKCQELINLGVNINAKDSFDYTPLIIASLCGHFELVRLLLESGALAEKNTFQGERCVHNALNDRIRKLLLHYDFSKTSDPHRYCRCKGAELRGALGLRERRLRMGFAQQTDGCKGLGSNGWVLLIRRGPVVSTQPGLVVIVYQWLYSLRSEEEKRGGGEARRGIGQLFAPPSESPVLSSEGGTNCTRREEGAIVRGQRVNVRQCIYISGVELQTVQHGVDLAHQDVVVDGVGCKLVVGRVPFSRAHHAAWDLRVRRLEEFAARYLAGRLEDYIDDPDFHDLIRQSAARIRRREETDSIELLDDIRYYLSERFRLRFEDPRLEDMLTPDAEKHLELLEDHESVTGARPAKPHVGEAGQGRQQQEQHRGQERTPVDAGVVRAREGDTADDEFASDAINYDVLMGKIDSMLDSLKLDA